MRVSTILLVVAAFLLAACKDQRQPTPVLSPTAEKVELVLYYSDGDSDFKTVGETILLNTGETIKVQRKKIRPDPSLITQDWNGKFLTAANSPPTHGLVDLSLDRENGVVCNGDKCAILYDICPHLSSLKAGQKCQSFARN